MKYIINENQYILLRESSSTDVVLSKIIQNQVLNDEKYFWITKVHSVETEEREDGLDARILLELSPKFKNDYPRLNRGTYSKEDGGWLYYGMEIGNYKKGIDPYDVSRKIKEVAKVIGFNPHFSLFSVFFIYVGERTPDRYHP